MYHFILVLDYLNAACIELRDFRKEFYSETNNVKHRMSALETAMMNVTREVAAGDQTDARHQGQLDQIVECLCRLEKRLELT